MCPQLRVHNYIIALNVGVYLCINASVNIVLKQCAYYVPMFLLNIIFT